ncbi:MAG TPA: hypothetical protein VMD59_03545, partial [Acidimicrobiales bacterium]|nr:hypothetical protein [Acidimicrobiales bacterium]
AIEASGGFGPCRIESYHWGVTYPASRWLELLSTHSEHRVLDPASRTRLFEALGRLYDGRSGEVGLSYTTFCIVAPRS